MWVDFVLGAMVMVLGVLIGAAIAHSTKGGD